MTEKPTYEDLEQRIEELETAAIERDTDLKALKESEEKYRTIFETVPVSIIVINEKGRNVEINPFHLEHVGKGKGTKEEYLKDIIMEHPSVVGAGLSETFRGVLEGKSFDNREIYFPTTTGGTDAYFNVRGAPLVRKGNVFGGIIAHEDISERVRAREKLQKAYDELEEKVRERTKELRSANKKLAQEIQERTSVEKELLTTKALLDSAIAQSPVPMSVVTLDGILETINEAAGDILGFSQDEVRSGMNVSEMKKSWQTYDSEGDLVPLEQIPIMRALRGEVTKGKEYRIVRKDGSERWEVVYAVPVKDQQGHILAAFTACPDITERKRAEDQIRVLNDKFSGIFKFSPNAISITTMEGRRILDVNDRYLQLSGYSREEILGQTISGMDLWASPDENEKFKDLLKEKGEVQNFEFIFNRKSKGPGTGLMSAVRIELAGEPCLIGILNDITTFKQLESQLRQAHKMEAVGTLAGGIAHEFNNILGIIIGNMEQAMDDVPEWNSAYSNLKEIRTASLRARDVVKQILAFSRQTMHELKPVGLNPIVSESLKLLRSSIPSTIEIRKNIATDSDMILADHTQVNQILLNLCTNAAHTMRNKGGIMEVSVNNISLDEESAKFYQDLTPGKYVELTVRDTGTGIEKDTIDRIFDPYFTTKEVGEGSGMGLAVVHGIVKEHQGDITVSSELGKGTSFRVLIPNVEVVIKPETENNVPLLRGSERILFVDDEESLCLAAKRNLEDLGYRVKIERNPVRALNAFEDEPEAFDLIITDTTMPEMTGDKLAQEIMKIRPDMPVILCTGYSERISEEDAKKMGIGAFVLKPILKDEIATTIRMVLDHEKWIPSGGERIIIVDDDEQMRSMLKQTLESDGYHVSEAPDGNVALWLYKENAADLIVMDIIMPEKEGIETIMELKRDYPGVKILAISGGGAGDPEGYLKLAKQIGADRTLAKPFEKEALLMEVRDLL